MRRFFLNLAAFAFGVLLVAVPMLAYADTVVAASTTYPLEIRYSSNSGITNKATPQEVCPANTTYTPSGSIPAVQTYNATFSAGSCVGSVSTYNNIGKFTCTSGRMASPDGKSCTGAAYCPDSSYVLSGTTCTRPDCVSPQVRQPDGTCKAPCVEGQTVSSGLYPIGSDPGASLRPNVTCSPQGCIAVFSGTSPAARSLVNGVATYYAKGSFITWAESCTSGASTPNGSPTVPPDTCAAGQAKITINGVSKCVAIDPTDPTDPTDPGIDPTDPTDPTDPGTDPTDPEEPEEPSRTANGGCDIFVCDGDAIDCSIAKASWESACHYQKLKYTEASNCNSMPECTGDAIQCGIAATAWKQRCQMAWAELDNELAQEYIAAKAQLDAGTTSNIVAEKDASSWFSLQNHIQGPSECPVDISIPVFGKTVTAPIAWLCGYLGIIALVIKLLAWIQVGRMVMGAF